MTWYEGSRRLYGNGTLSALASGDIVVESRTTFLFEDRDWITFTPGSPGTYDVGLQADAQTVRTVRVVAVSEDGVDGIALYGEDESRVAEGALLTVLAQAHGVDGRPIFGVEYAWDLDSDPEDGFGDLYRYVYAPQNERTLCARFETLEATATIHADEGFVDSTNDLGCEAVGAGAPAGGVLPLVAALLFLRRRRRESRPMLQRERKIT